MAYLTLRKEREGRGFPAKRHGKQRRVRLYRKESRMKFINATKLHRKSGY